METARSSRPPVIGEPTPARVLQAKDCGCGPFRAPGFAAFPIIVFDQLSDIFTLLPAPGQDANLPPEHLTPDVLDALIGADQVQAGLKNTNADVVFAGPLATRFRTERNAEE